MINDGEAELNAQVEEREAVDRVWREVVTVLLAFKRFSAPAIAQAFGMNLEVIEEMARDPDVRDTVKALRKLLPKPRDLEELLASDADKNVRWLKRLRDGRVDRTRLGTDAKTLRVRQRAAEVLLDRQAPKKLSIAMPAQRVIDVTPAQVARMRHVLSLPEVRGEDEVPDEIA